MSAALYSPSGFARIAGSVLALGALALSPAGRAQDGWIAIQAGAQYRIVDDGKKQTLPIAIALKGVKPADVTLTLIAVRFDTALMPKLLDAFSIQPKLANSESAAQQVLLTVDTQKASRAGSYEVWIDARAAARPDAAGAAQGAAAEAAGIRPEVLKINIEHPAAALRVPASVAIEIVIRPWVANYIRATPLKLELTTDASRLSGLVLGNIRYPTGKPITGSLSLAEPLSDLAANASVERKWTVEGEFPLGATEADSEIRADQLKEPVAFKVSIRTRRTLIWLFLAAAVGLLFGWFLKVRLTSYLQLRSARLEGLRVLDAIDEERARYPDLDGEAALAAARKQLSKAAAAGNAEEITKLAASAKEELAKTLENLRKSQLALKHSLDEWTEAVALERDGLADEIKGIAAGAARRLRDAAAKLGSSVEQARKELDRTQRKLIHDLKVESARWKKSIDGALKLLEDPSELSLPREVRSEVNAEAGALRKDLQASVDPAPTDAKSVAKLLNEIERIRAQTLIGLIEPARERLGDVVNAFLHVLDGALAAGSEQRRALESAVAAAQARLSRDSVEDRVRALAPGGAEELRELDRQFRGILQTDRVAAGPQAEIDRAIAARDYVAAARTLVEAKKPAKKKDKILSIEAGGALPEEAAAEPAEAAELAGRPARAKVVVAASRSVALPQLEPIVAAPEVRVSVARTLWEIRRAELFQTLLVGVVFLLVAYVTYADSYVGTFKEHVAIFFWALSADLTVTKLLEAVKGSNRPASAG